MIDSALAFAGPGELASLVRARTASPRELVELFLERIGRLDPQLNAFRVTFAEQALAEAERLAEAPDLGDRPLAGVPFAVKDDTALTGQAATRGSRSPAAPASADAVLVARLRTAGAIPVGITNAPELMIFPWTASAAHGITRNPWDPTRTPGGSSGGSAAAVAAGLVPLATASDGGGSIRIPAAATGLVGLKPTHGRLPGDGGWLGLAVSGTLARTVADAALTLDVTHREPGAARTAPSYLEATRRDPGRLRIAISRRPPPGVLVRVSADQRRAYEATAQRLADLGHEVEVRHPRYGTVQIRFLQMWLRGVYEESLTLADRTAMESGTRQMAAGGRFLVPPWRRARVLAGRPAAVRRITALWDEFDVLMTPALASTAIAAEGGYGRAAPLAIDLAGRFSPFTSFVNLTGQPALAVPAGLGTDGLPLAVQLVGRPGAEDVLLALAAQLEASGAAPGRPPVS